VSATEPRKNLTHTHSQEEQGTRNGRNEKEGRTEERTTLFCRHGVNLVLYLIIIVLNARLLLLFDLGGVNLRTI
jgi:hypothetical protein